MTLLLIMRLSAGTGGADQWAHQQVTVWSCISGWRDYCIKAVLHTLYKHFSAAFDGLKWDQGDSSFKGLLFPIL